MGHLGRGASRVWLLVWAQWAGPTLILGVFHFKYFKYKVRGAGLSAALNNCRGMMVVVVMFNYLMILGQCLVEKRSNNIIKFINGIIIESVGPGQARQACAAPAQQARAHKARESGAEARQVRTRYHDDGKLGLLAHLGALEGQLLEAQPGLKDHPVREHAERAQHHAPQVPAHSQAQQRTPLRKHFLLHLKPQRQGL